MPRRSTLICPAVVLLVAWTNGVADAQLRPGFTPATPQAVPRPPAGVYSVPTVSPPPVAMYPRWTYPPVYHPPAVGPVTSYDCWGGVWTPVYCVYRRTPYPYWPGYPLGPYSAYRW